MSEAILAQSIAKLKDGKLLGLIINEHIYIQYQNGNLFQVKWGSQGLSGKDIRTEITKDDKVFNGIRTSCSLKTSFLTP